jgi:acyl carrier protein
MTDDEIRKSFYDALRRVAPESEPASLDADADIRDELDIDSMDFLRVMISLHTALGIDIPERDYSNLYTPGGALDYLRRRLRKEA